MRASMPASAAAILLLLAVAGGLAQQPTQQRPPEFGPGPGGWRAGSRQASGEWRAAGPGPVQPRPGPSQPGPGPMRPGSGPGQPGPGPMPGGQPLSQPPNAGPARTGFGPAQPGPGFAPGAQRPLPQQPLSPSDQRGPPPAYSPGSGPGMPGTTQPTLLPSRGGEGRQAADGGPASDRGYPLGPAPAAGQQPRPAAAPGVVAPGAAPIGGAGGNVTVPARVVCYYTNWAQRRAFPSMFYPEDIDANMCTHINFAFARVSHHTLMPTTWNDVDMYARIQNLKLKNPNLKVLLSVGGWNHGTKNFTEVAFTPASRATFVQNVVAYLKQYGFDGLDLVWMYPGAEDSPPEDKKRFTFLVQELRNTFDHESSMSGKVGLLLTAAVSANEVIVNRAYEIDRLAECLDWVNLMTYDMRTANQTLFAQPHSSLYGPPGDPFTVDYAVRMWIYNGMPPRKVVIGLPMYGRSFHLATAADHNVNANSIGAGDLGLFTVSPGFLAYFEICQDRDFLRNEMFDMLRRVPYSWNKKLDWIGYESPRSMIEKCHFIQGAGIGGAMIWTLDLDDFSGAFCNAGKYPLLRELSSCLIMSLSSHRQTAGGKQTTDSPPTDRMSQQAARPGLGPNQQQQLSQQQPLQQQLQLHQQQLHVQAEQRPGLQLPAVRPLPGPAAVPATVGGGQAQHGIGGGSLAWLDAEQQRRPPPLPAAPREPTKSLWGKEEQEGKIIGAAEMLFREGAAKQSDDSLAYGKHHGKRPLLSALEAIGGSGCAEVFLCPESAHAGDSLYSDPCDCTKFYECNDRVAVRRSCPKLSAWESSAKRCKHYKEVASCHIDITDI